MGSQAESNAIGQGKLVSSWRQREKAAAENNQMTDRWD